MKIAIFSTKAYDEQFLAPTLEDHEAVFLEPRLSRQTAVSLMDALTTTV